TNYITKSKKISQLFLQKGLELENMEFFSVMAVAKEFNIPAGGVFVVTNYCYEDAHKEFLENHSRALDILKSYLIDKGVVR
ncbi:MAG: purine-nucleoside phosphorylase, partial [Epsilonproteobacteria bacterium]|nr:purine-nucleoside phosphorylase [Campylobacterota bacterium]